MFLTEVYKVTEEIWCRSLFFQSFLFYIDILEYYRKTYRRIKLSGLQFVFTDKISFFVLLNKITDD